jgi:hypothetical protein
MQVPPSQRPASNSNDCLFSGTKKMAKDPQAYHVFGSGSNYYDSLQTDQDGEFQYL